MWAIYGRSAEEGPCSILDAFTGVLLQPIPRSPTGSALQHIPAADNPGGMYWKKHPQQPRKAHRNASRQRVLYGSGRQRSVIGSRAVAAADARSRSAAGCPTNHDGSPAVSAARVHPGVVCPCTCPVTMRKMTVSRIVGESQ